MTLQLNQIRKYALTAVLIILLALLYAVKKVNAVTQTTFSGSCGMLVNFHNNGWENKAANQQPNNVTKSAIGTINFDTSRWNFELTIMSNYGGTGTVSESKSKVSGTSTFNSFDSDTGLYKYTVTIDGSAGTMDFSMLPVNSGNSFLVSGQIASLDITNGPLVTGICQKV